MRPQHDAGLSMMTVPYPKNCKLDAHVIVARQGLGLLRAVVNRLVPPNALSRSLNSPELLEFPTQQLLNSVYLHTK